MTPCATDVMPDGKEKMETIVLHVDVTYYLFIFNSKNKHELKIVITHQSYRAV